MEKKILQGSKSEVESELKELELKNGVIVNGMCTAVFGMAIVVTVLVELFPRPKEID